MRIPFLLVSFSAVVTVIGTALLCIPDATMEKKIDQQELDAICRDITEQPSPYQYPKNNETEQVHEPILELGDLTALPTLEEYQELARQKGAAHLLSLAQSLFSFSQHQRALLAYERILDSTTAEPATQALALKEKLRIQKLLREPLPLPYPEVKIVLTVECNSTMKTEISKSLESIIPLLNNASKGIINFSYIINATIKSQKSSQDPPSIMLSLNKAELKKTNKIVSLPVLFQPDTPLKPQLTLTIDALLRDHLNQNTNCKAPPMVPLDAPTDDIFLRYTRLSWLQMSYLFKTIL